jgi:hypothetical protein
VDESGVSPVNIIPPWLSMLPFPLSPEKYKAVITYAKNENKKVGKAIPPHAMQALGERRGIAHTYS